MLYMVSWIPSIYPSHVSIYTSTMDPMGYGDWQAQDSPQNFTTQNGKSSVSTKPPFWHSPNMSQQFQIPQTVWSGLRPGVH